MVTAAIYILPLLPLSFLFFSLFLQPLLSPPCTNKKRQQRHVCASAARILRLRASQGSLKGTDAGHTALPGRSGNCAASGLSGGIRLHYFTIRFSSRILSTFLRPIFLPFFLSLSLLLLLPPSPPPSSIVFKTSIRLPCSVDLHQGFLCRP